MKIANDNRMRITLTDRQADQLAKLRALYTSEGGGLVTAHDVLKVALTELYEREFLETKRQLPPDWEAYRK